MLCGRKTFADESHHPYEEKTHTALFVFRKPPAFENKGRLRKAPCLLPPTLEKYIIMNVIAAKS